MRTAADQRRPAPRPRGARLVRHRRLRRQRAARRRHRRRRRARSRTAGRPSRSTPGASTPTPRPAGSYRAFGASHLQWCGELQVDEIARRCGLDALEIREREPARTRASRSAPGGKPLDADLVGDVAGSRRASTGTAPKPEGTSAAACPSACSPPARIRSRPRSCAWRRTARLTCSSARPRSARAHAPSSPRSRPRSWRCRRAGPRRRRRHRSSRPTTAPPGASRSTTLAGLAVQRAARDVRAQLLAIAARSSACRRRRSTLARARPGTRRVR